MKKVKGYNFIMPMMGSGTSRATAPAEKKEEEADRARYPGVV